MDNHILPGMVVPSNSPGNAWSFTIVHPTFGVRRHARTFATCAEAKQAMREFVAKWNNTPLSP